MSAPATEAAVHVERHGGLAVVTLNRPGKFNALSTALEQELLDALGTHDVATSRAVVFTGAGRAFSAGADVTEVAEFGAQAIAAYYRGSGRVYEAVAALEQPTVSAIHGYCLGGGLELALTTDIRVADGTAVFGLPEVGLGIVPSSGGLTRLVRILGTARARELILLGSKVDAETAHRLGLLTEVVPEGQARQRALEVADTLAGKPALAVAVAKQAIDAVAESSNAAALLIERLAYGMLNQVEQASR
ncbi:MAG: enoyl-CoA hydratase/isomerase family protein [Actinophytocola sp.]|nr:enoyl-CoA hydratase/isomerase family protein [Actinophytocola sp.]